MRDLYALLQEQETRDVCISYGINPTAVEEYLASKPLHYRDDTADIAVANADRDLARKRRRR